MLDHPAGVVLGPAGLLGELFEGEPVEAARVGELGGGQGLELRGALGRRAEGERQLGGADQQLTGSSIDSRSKKRSAGLLGGRARLEQQRGRPFGPFRTGAVSRLRLGHTGTSCFGNAFHCPAPAQVRSGAGACRVPARAGWVGRRSVAAPGRRGSWGARPVSPVQRVGRVVQPGDLTIRRHGEAEAVEAGTSRLLPPAERRLHLVRGSRPDWWTVASLLPSRKTTTAHDLSLRL